MNVKSDFKVSTQEEKDFLDKVAIAVIPFLLENNETSVSEDAEMAYLVAAKMLAERKNFHA